MILDQDKKQIDVGGISLGIRCTLLAGVIIAVVSLFAGHGSAGTHSWIDKNGSLHIVDDPSKIPPEYRKTMVDGSDEASAQQPLTRRPDGQKTIRTVGGISDISGPWIEKAELYDEFRDDNLVLQLDADGGGYSIGTRFLRTVKMRITWRMMNDSGIEIVRFRNVAKHEKTTAVYDQNFDEIKLTYGAKTMRRMKRSLPATARVTHSSREAPLAGLWSNSETERNSYSYFTFEQDGTGIMFAKWGYYYFAPFSWKMSPGGSVDLAFKVVSSDNTEGVSLQRNLSKSGMTMQYDDKADMLYLSDGKWGEAMLRVGDSLFRGTQATPDVMKKLEKRDGLINIARQGNSSAALIVAQHYFSQGEYAEGINLLCRAAEAGNSEAQYMRGLMQYFGQNTPVNKKEGLKWIRRAVSGDHAAAIGFLDRVEQRKEIGNNAKTNLPIRNDPASADASQDVDIQQLISGLQGPDATIRQRSAGQLGALMATEAVEPLIVATRDSHVSVQKTAIYALSLIGDQRSIPAIIAAVNSPQESIRGEAINALRKIGQPALEQIGIAINDERGNFVERRAMCQLLGDIGDKRAVAPLIKALQTSEISSRAAQALAMLGDVSAIPPLIELLKRPGPKWAGGREAAVISLERLGGPSAIEALILKLEDENISYFARTSLIRMSKKDTQVLSALASTMRNKNMNRVIFESAKVLINMGEAGKEQLLLCSKDSACEGRTSAEYVLANAKVFKE